MVFSLLWETQDQYYHQQYLRWWFLGTAIYWVLSRLKVQSSRQPDCPEEKCNTGGLKNWHFLSVTN